MEIFIAIFLQKHESLCKRVILFFAINNYYTYAINNYFMILYRRYVLIFLHHLFPIVIKYGRKPLSAIHANVANRPSQLFALNHTNSQRFPL